MAKRKVPEPQTAPAESFEESLTELQSIVSELEDGSLGLEPSLARFERGVGLLRACSIILESAEQKIETLTRFNDTAQPVPPIASPSENGTSFNQTHNGVAEEDAANSGRDYISDMNSAKSSLF